jgi:hypothetical protein
MLPVRSRMMPWWAPAARLASAASVNAYVSVAYRIRGWGDLPSFDEPALIVSNHQIDLDLMAVISRIALAGGWNAPFFAAAAKLMHEPGFLACRVPWLRKVVHNVCFSPLFHGLGFLPIENQLRTRSLARWAFAVERRHGPTPLERVFCRSTIERHALSGLSTGDLFTQRYCEFAQATTATISELLQPHRDEQVRDTRDGVRADLSRLEAALRNGASIYVTPEGHYSRDGAMLRFRGIWERLAPHAKTVYITAISYDPFVGRRLSQLYRVVRLHDRNDVIPELRAARPITVSAMLSAWLHNEPGPHTERDAIAAVNRIYGSLPSGVFVDPEFERRSEALVREAFRNAGVRRHAHAQFAQVDDLVAFQARFFRETVEAAVTRARVEVAQVAPRVHHNGHAAIAHSTAAQ